MTVEMAFMRKKKNEKLEYKEKSLMEPTKLRRLYAKLLLIPSRWLKKKKKAEAEKEEEEKQNVFYSIY